MNHTSPTSHSTTPSSAQPVSIKQALMTQGRMGQLLDEDDHKRCSEGNHRALLSENLDQLRSLVTMLKAEDWMYRSSAFSQSAEPANLANSR